MLSDRHCHGVFAIIGGPVIDFQAIYALDDGPVGSLLHRQRGLRSIPAAIGVDKGLAVGMRSEHDSIDLVDALAQGFGVENAGDVLFQAIHQDMAEIGAHLHTTEDEKIVLAGELTRQVAIPATIMLRHHDTVKARGFAVVNELERREVAVVRSDIGVHMHIENHWFSSIFSGTPSRQQDWRIEGTPRWGDGPCTVPFLTSRP